MNFSGNIVDYFIVYWGGVLVSFTPCVYPILPITASFIAGMNPRGNKLLGFFISSVYVLGMAIVYCALAVFAALSGKVFGQLQNSPVVFLIVANVMMFFALVMLDAIHLPNIGLSIQHHKIKPKNIWMILLMGMVSGLVVGPCTAPALGSLLLYVGSKQNIIHAVSLLFVFSYGVGTSLIVVGTFVGILENLPKSGAWLKIVKQIGGLVLIIFAEYFLIQAGRLLF